MSASLTRLSLEDALDFVETSAWAYKATDGHLRCPDCNSNGEHLDGLTFGEGHAAGAVALKGYETCFDCGVLLIEDEASPPWEVTTPEEAEALMGFYRPLIQKGVALPTGEDRVRIERQIFAALRAGKESM